MLPQRGFGGDGARCRLSEERNPDMPSNKTIKTAKARPASLARKLSRVSAFA